MIRLLFTALLCVLASSQATAQNWLSQALLELDEDHRNEMFTYLLRDSNAKCDRVIRTLFNGSTVQLEASSSLIGGPRRVVSADRHIPTVSCPVAALHFST
jgi:hypothetical protein